MDSNNDHPQDDRKMNDSTMPPPKPSTTMPPPQDRPPSQKPKAATGIRKKQGRFGMAEWNRLLKVSKDLAQRRGEPLRRIPMSEVAQHDAVYDGWTVLRGKVFCISPYLAYHPGGETILKRILGRDCTELFDRYHRWVNADG